MSIDSKAEVDSTLVQLLNEGNYTPAMRASIRRARKVINAIDKQRLPIEDAATLLIGHYWVENPHTVRDNLIQLFPNIEVALDIKLDGGTIRRQIDRFMRLDQEYVMVERRFGQATGEELV